MLYRYRSDPPRPALILIAVVIVLAMLAPTGLLRGLIAVFLTGPLAWLALQLLRRGRGVSVTAERLQVHANLTRRSLTVPFSQLQAYTTTNGDQLAFAYLQPRRIEAGDEPRPPRLRVYVTAALIDPEAVRATLPQAHGITPSQLNELLLWRRIRRVLYWLIGLFIVFPLLIIFGLRLGMSIGLRTVF